MFEEDEDAYYIVGELDSGETKTLDKMYTLKSAINKSRDFIANGISRVYIKKYNSRIGYFGVETLGKED